MLYLVISKIIIYVFKEKVKKVTKLEQACLHQERVIENMEKVLKSKKFSTDDVSKALNEENERLRMELQKLRVSESTLYSLFCKIVHSVSFHLRFY